MKEVIRSLEQELLKMGLRFAANVWPNGVIAVFANEDDVEAFKTEKEKAGMPTMLINLGETGKARLKP